MSDTPEQQEYSEQQRAFLTAQTAAQAATAATPAAEQAATAAQMTDRGPLLPAETEADQLMAMLKAQSDQIAQLTKQVGIMQKATEDRQAAEGGPLVIRYAKGALDKLRATAVAHPDLGPDHFAAPITAAGQLVDAATTLSRTGGSPDAVQSAASALDRWLTKTHWRTGRKPIDFSAIADDIETAVDEALKLAA